MAGQIELSSPIMMNQSILNMDVPQIDDPTAESFSEVLNKMNKMDTLPKTSHSSKRITESYRLKEFLKRMMKDITDGDFKDTLKNAENLSEKDLEELKSIIKKLKELAEKEMNGDFSGVRLQEYINSLFQIESSDSGQTDEDYTLDVMLDRIHELKKVQADANAIVSELVPPLVQLTEKVTAENENPTDLTVPIVNGEISFKDDPETTYTFSLQSFHKLLTQVEEQLNGAPEVPIIPEPPVIPEIPEVTDPENTVPETPETTDPENTVPETDDTVPETPEATDPENTVPETDDTVPETPEATDPENTVPETDDTVPEVEENTEQSTDEIVDEELTEEENSEDKPLDNRVNQKTDELSEVLSNLSAQRNTQVQDISENIVAKPVAIQIADSVATMLRHPKIGTSELTMTLNPSNLGQLHIRIINEGGRLSVAIAAQSEITQKILEDRVTSLVTSLRNINNNIDDVKVVKPTEAEFANFNLNDFSSNQQANQSNNGRNNYIQYAKEVHYASEVAESKSAEGNTPYKGGSRLWQTA